jgi:RHS repeat-associated protein
MRAALIRVIRGVRVCLLNNRRNRRHRGAPVPHHRCRQARYLPYGQERWTSGPAQTDFTFTGQRADNYTHLIEMGARWYDPQLNRWISPDSIVQQPANPQTLNRYSYANANPVRYNDPSGHCAFNLLNPVGG